MARKTDGAASNTHVTREAWLDSGVGLLRPLFQEFEHPLPPNIRTGVGYGPQGSNVKRMGGNLPSEASTGDNCEIWIRPELADEFEVLTALVAELVSTVVPADAGRGAEYRRVALDIGLKGSMREPNANPALRGRLNAITAELGPLNHAAVKSDYKRPKRQRKRQTCRSFAAMCPRCESIIRLSPKTLQVGGMPICEKDKVPYARQEKEETEKEKEKEKEFLKPRENEVMSLDASSSEEVAEGEMTVTPDLSDVASETHLRKWFAKFKVSPEKDVRESLKASGGTYKVEPEKHWVGVADGEVATVREVVRNAGGEFRLEPAEPTTEDASPVPLSSDIRNPSRGDTENPATSAIVTPRPLPVRVSP